MRRRALLPGLLAALPLAGCGFALRRPPELQLRSLRLAGFRPRSPLAEQLRAAIAATATTTLVEPPAVAQAVLEAITDAREKSVVATTAAGQVREFQLRARFEFRLRNAAGRELIGPTQILLTRDLSWSETAALAKEQEEQQLFRAMEGDIVAQVMRRLAAVTIA